MKPSPLKVKQGNGMDAAFFMVSGPLSTLLTAEYNFEAEREGFDSMLIKAVPDSKFWWIHSYFN